MYIHLYIIDLIMEHVYMGITVGKWSIDFYFVLLGTAGNSQEVLLGY